MPASNRLVRRSLREHFYEKTSNNLLKTLQLVLGYEAVAELATAVPCTLVTP